MNVLKQFDFVKFHTPINEKEKKEIYLVVDELADDEDVRSLLVMENSPNAFYSCYKHFSQGRFQVIVSTNRGRN